MGETVAQSEKEDLLNWDQLLKDDTQSYTKRRDGEPKTDEDWIIALKPGKITEYYQELFSSSAVRALQDKTQVYALDSDLYTTRTRLSHSLEVSTIAQNIARAVSNRFDLQLTIKKFSIYKEEHEGNSLAKVTDENKRAVLEREYIAKAEEVCGKKPEAGVFERMESALGAAGLLHDLGNPAFGHVGEAIIGEWFDTNICDDSGILSDFGLELTDDQKNDLKVFEGNAQTFRILAGKMQSGDMEDIKQMTNDAPDVRNAVVGSLVKYTVLNGDKNGDRIEAHKRGYFLSEQTAFKTMMENLGLRRPADTTYARHPLAFILEAADDIAYNTADLEDALIKGLIPKEAIVKERDIFAWLYLCAKIIERMATDRVNARLLKIDGCFYDCSSKLRDLLVDGEASLKKDLCVNPLDKSDVDHLRIILTAYHSSNAYKEAISSLKSNLKERIEQFFGGSFEGAPGSGAMTKIWDEYIPATSQYEHAYKFYAKLSDAFPGESNSVIPEKVHSLIREYRWMLVSDAARVFVHNYKAVMQLEYNGSLLVDPSSYGVSLIKSIGEFVHTYAHLDRDTLRREEQARMYYDTILNRLVPTTLFFAKEAVLENASLDEETWKEKLKKHYPDRVLVKQDDKVHTFDELPDEWKLPEDVRKKLKESYGGKREFCYQALRATIDQVAGMTDRYAYDLFCKITGAPTSSVLW